MSIDHYKVSSVDCAAPSDDCKVLIDVQKCQVSKVSSDECLVFSDVLLVLIDHCIVSRDGHVKG